MTDRAELNTLKDDTIADIKALLQDAEHLYDNVKEDSHEHAHEAKAKMKERLSSAKSKLEQYEREAKHKARAAVEHTRTYAKENPATTTGIVAAATVLLGVLAYKSVRK